MGRIYFCILALLVASGCKDSATKVDEDQLVLEVSIRSCEELLAEPNLSRYARTMTELVIEQRRNNRLDPQPVLVQALLVQPKTKKAIYLAPWISDEDGDVLGIGVKEYHRKPTGETTVIEEEYPVFAHKTARIASYYIIPISIRKADERKNAEAWERYLVQRLSSKKAMPEVWISVPDPGKIDVEVWIYDRAGFKSRGVMLVNRLGSGNAGK